MNDSYLIADNMFAFSNKQPLFVRTTVASPPEYSCRQIEKKGEFDSRALNKTRIHNDETTVRAAGQMLFFIERVLKKKEHCLSYAHGLNHGGLAGLSVQQWKAIILKRPTGHVFKGPCAT